MLKIVHCCLFFFFQGKNILCSTLFKYYIFVNVFQKNSASPHSQPGENKVYDVDKENLKKELNETKKELKAMKGGTSTLNTPYDFMYFTTTLQNIKTIIYLTFEARQTLNLFLL